MALLYVLMWHARHVTALLLFYTTTLHGLAEAPPVATRSMWVGAGGSLTRAKDQERIEFLASARNRALEPLWLNSSLATSTSLLLPHDPEVCVTTLYCSVRESSGAWISVTTM